MEVGSINFQSAIGECAEYIRKGQKGKEAISVVISPLKVNQAEDGNSLKCISGCNMWKSCANDGCQYSLAARPER